MELLHSLDAARGVTNLTTVSPLQKKIDRRHRNRAQKALDGLLPDLANVDVRVFGLVAVLPGHVPLLTHKLDAELIITRKLPVAWVVNKIRVE